MRPKLHRFTLLVTLFGVSLLATADPAEAGGISYEVNVDDQLPEPLPDNQLSSNDYSYRIYSNGGGAEITEYNGPRNIENLVIPSTVEINGEILPVVSIADTDDAFGGTGIFQGMSMFTVTLPEQLVNIGHNAFRNCTFLTSITLPETLITIGVNAFYGCSSLPQITIPDAVQTINREAFSGCRKLAEITISTNSNLQGTFPAYGFDACAIEEIYIPKGITGFDDRPFGGCANLRKIEFAEDIQLEELGRLANGGDIGLKSIRIPASVKTLNNLQATKLESITFAPGSQLEELNGSFGSHDVLTSIELPETVKGIRGGTFAGCKNINYLRLPQSVFAVEAGAFNEFGNSRTILVVSRTDISRFDENAFEGMNSGVMVRVPTDMLPTWKEKYPNLNYIEANTTSITLDENLDLTVNNTATITPVILPLEAVQHVIWSSSNEEVATVDQNGMVTGTGVGTATITATAMDGTGITGTCEVSVNYLALESIEYARSSYNIKVGGSFTLPITTSPANASERDFALTSSDPSIVSVKNDGTIKANKQGVATITASSRRDPSVTATTTVTVNEFQAAEFTITPYEDNGYVVIQEATTGRYLRGYNLLEYSSFMNVDGKEIWNICPTGSEQSVTSVDGDGTYNVYNVGHRGYLAFDHGEDRPRVQEPHEVAPRDIQFISTGHDTYYMAVEGEMLQYDDRDYISFYKGKGTYGDWTFSKRHTIADVQATSCIITEYNGTIGEEYTVPKYLDDEHKYVVCGIGKNYFKGNTTLKKLTIPCDITSIADSSFIGCSSLRELILQDGATPLYVGHGKGEWGHETYYAPLFNDCALEKVHLGRNLVYKMDYWEGVAPFFHNYTISDVEIGSYVTSIPSHLFYDCKSLDQMVIPTNVTAFEEKAFKGTDIELHLQSTTPPTLKKESSDSPTFGEVSLFVVPTTALVNYKEADGWNRYESSIVPFDGYKREVTTEAQSNRPGIYKAIFGRETSTDDANLGYEDDLELKKIAYLKVKGTINSYDLIVFRNKMLALRHLDLSDATIVYSDHEYYTGYHSENDELGTQVFFNTSVKLQSIVLPKGTKRIGSGAFANQYLRQVTLNEGLEYIDEAAFSCCGYLKSVHIPSSVRAIGSRSFETTSLLETVTFGEDSQLTRIPYAAFANSGIREITLPSTIEDIEMQAFVSCKNLQRIELPSLLNTIDQGAFEYCDNLMDVYASRLEPITIAQNSFSGSYTRAKLHTPGFEDSFQKYRWNTEWSQFTLYDKYDPTYDNIGINKDFTLGNDERIKGNNGNHYGQIKNPNGHFNAGSGFIVHGKAEQSMGNVYLKYENGIGASIIGDENIKIGADSKLYMQLKIQGGRWYFFSFPFNVLRTDITCDGMNFVFRKYDGDARAKNGHGGWVDLTAEDTHLTAGAGYIFQAEMDGTLILPVDGDKVQFSNEDVQTTLNTYTAANDQDASWNFIGNPYPCYYPLSELGYTAPITVRNGDNYESIRPGDDGDYILAPYEAFFVQRTSEGEYVGYNGQDMMTYTQGKDKAKANKASRLEKGINPERLLVNIELSDGTNTDKTRVVFNDKQQMGYEMGCDAPKFMGSANGQLYTLDNKGVKYAINERPMESGSVKLALQVAKAGHFTLSASRMDIPMLLRDNQTGITHDLSVGSYEFDVKAGVIADRFTLVCNKNATSISEIMAQTGVSVMAGEGGVNVQGAADASVSIYDLKGVQVAADAEGFIALPAAPYIVKVNNMSTKVLVK